MAIKKSENMSHMVDLYSDIIGRIEHVRKISGLNKSKFSAGIGMKPQTYNNFIGVQRSKPNVDLLFGVVDKYGVNPYWLLRGVGPIFASDEKNISAAEKIRSDSGSELFEYEKNRESQIAEGFKELREKLEGIDPMLDDVRKYLRELGSSQYPLLEALMQLLKKYMELDPKSATNEINSILVNLRMKFGDS